MALICNAGHWYTNSDSADHIGCNQPKHDQLDGVPKHEYFDGLHRYTDGQGGGYTEPDKRLWDKAWQYYIDHDTAIDEYINANAKLNQEIVYLYDAQNGLVEVLEMARKDETQLQQELENTRNELHAAYQTLEATRLQKDRLQRALIQSKKDHLRDRENYFFLTDAYYDLQEELTLEDAKNQEYHRLFHEQEEELDEAKVNAKRAYGFMKERDTAQAQVRVLVDAAKETNARLKGLGLDEKWGLDEIQAVLRTAIAAVEKDSCSVRWSSPLGEERSVHYQEGTELFREDRLNPVHPAACSCGKK